MHTFRPFILLLVTALMASLITLSAVPEPGDAGGPVRSYTEGQPLQPLIALDQRVEQALPDPAARKALAAELAGWLQGEDTTPAARTVICQRLARVATADEVPVLAALLHDPDSSADALLVLQVMEGNEAASALRAGLEKLEGLPLAGVVYALGARRDGAAVPRMIALLGDADPDVEAAAVWALGETGPRPALEALQRVEGPAVAAALISGAERVAADDLPLARRILAALMDKTRPVPQRMAALATLVHVAGAGAAPEVRLAMDDPDPRLRAAALQWAGDIPGAPWTAELAARLPERDAARRVELIHLLARRGDRTAREAVLGQVQAENPLVRAAAVEALGSLGEAEDARMLMAMAAGDDAALRPAAEAALATLAAEGVDEAIVSALDAGPVAQRVAAITAVAARGQISALPALHALLNDEVLAVRTAAASALGQIGDESTYASLIDTLCSGVQPPVRQEIRRALVLLGRRLVAHEGRTAMVLAALDRETICSEAVPILLEALAEGGGDAGLKAVQDRLQHPDAAVRAAAARTLGQWPDHSAVPVLTALVRDPADARQRALALAGLLRLLPGLAEAEPLLESLWPLLDTDAERIAWMSAVQQLNTLAAFDLAAGCLDVEEVAEEARLAVARIGAALAEREPEAVARVILPLLAEDLGGPSRRALETVAERLRTPQMLREIAATRRAAVEELRGEGIAVYLNAGPEREARGADGVQIRVDKGEPYAWDAAGGAPASVAYDDDAVEMEVRGLDPGRTYALGFTWWDFDHGTREQSVWVGNEKVLDPTALPAWQARREHPTTHTVDVPERAVVAGAVRIRFRREGAVNAVVSEVWLTDRGVAEEVTVVPPSPEDTRRVLIVTGRDYPGHDWRRTTPALQAALEEDPRLEVTVSEEIDVLGTAELDSYHAIVLNYMNWEHPGPGQAALEHFRQTIEGGTGLVLVHFACGAFQDWPEFVRIAGRVWDPALPGHDPQGAFRVNIIDASHPVTAGLVSFDTVDELYTCLAGDTPVQMLATARSIVDGRDHPMAFTLRYGEGRVFHSVLGHDVRAIENPPVARLYRRAAAWAAGLEME